MFTPLPAEGKAKELLRRIGVAIISPFAYLALLFGRACFGKPQSSGEMIKKASEVNDVETRVANLSRAILPVIKRVIPSSEKVDSAKIYLTLDINGNKMTKDFLMTRGSQQSVLSIETADPGIAEESAIIPRAQRDLTIALAALSEDVFFTTSAHVGIALKTDQGNLYTFEAYEKLKQSRYSKAVKAETGHTKYLQELEAHQKGIKLFLISAGRTNVPEQIDAQGQFLL